MENEFVTWIDRFKELPKEDGFVVVRITYSGFNTGMEKEDLDIIPYHVPEEGESEYSFSMQEELNRTDECPDWTITHWMKIPSLNGHKIY